MFPINTVTREVLFENAQKFLLAEFEKAKSEIPHYGERGTETEEIVIKWLNDHMPKRFQSSGGFIIDDLDKVSPQTDVIIYDALNCPVLRYSNKCLIIPADNVAVAIEVKSRLNKTTYTDAATKIRAIKSLGKSPITDLDLLSEGMKKIVQRQTLGVVFAFECDSSLETVADWLRGSFLQDGYNGRHIDFIVVLNKGWIEPLVMLDGEVHPTIHPEPFYSVSPETIMELWLGINPMPEKSLLYFHRHISSQLQVFRTKTYAPYSGIFDQQRETKIMRVGALPNYPETHSDNVVETIKSIPVR